MPVFTDDNAPHYPCSGSLAIDNFNVAQKSANSPLERYVVSRPAKVRFQSVPFQYHAGRALFHEKVRHRVDFRRADFEREMEPRFLHKVLCHSTAKRSIVPAILRQPSC
jgi:hypothetical protein